MIRNRNYYRSMAGLMIVLLSLFTAKIAVASTVFCAFTIEGDGLATGGNGNFSGYIFWEVDTTSFVESGDHRHFDAKQGKVFISIEDGTNSVLADIKTITVSDNVNSGSVDAVSVNTSLFTSTGTLNPIISSLRFLTIDSTTLSSKDIPSDIAIYKSFQSKYAGLEYFDGTEMPGIDTASFSEFDGVCTNI